MADFTWRHPSPSAFGSHSRGTHSVLLRSERFSRRAGENAQAATACIQRRAHMVPPPVTRGELGLWASRIAEGLFTGAHFFGWSWGRDSLLVCTPLSARLAGILVRCMAIRARRPVRPQVRAAGQCGGPLGPLVFRRMSAPVPWPSSISSAIAVVWSGYWPPAHGSDLSVSLILAHFAADECP
jgi:hypothetical protein